MGAFFLAHCLNIFVCKRIKTMEYLGHLWYNFIGKVCVSTKPIIFAPCCAKHQLYQLNNHDNKSNQLSQLHRRAF